MLCIGNADACAAAAAADALGIEANGIHPRGEQVGAVGGVDAAGVATAAGCAPNLPVEIDHRAGCARRHRGGQTTAAAKGLEHECRGCGTTGEDATALAAERQSLAVTPITACTAQGDVDVEKAVLHIVDGVARCATAAADALKGEARAVVAAGLNQQLSQTHLNGASIPASASQAGGRGAAGGFGDHGAGLAAAAAD